MKKILKLALALLMVSVCLSAFACTPYSKAATPQDIEDSIVLGLEWLAEEQNPDGSWLTSLAHTAMAVLKFEERAVDLGEDPLDPAYQYYDQVRNGLDYVFTRAQIVNIAVQPAGDPDSDGDDIGVRFNQDDWHYTYGTGIAAMAIAASTHPEMTVSVAGSAVDGWTYLEVVDDTVDYMAFGQNDVGNDYRGGWGYYENYGWSDNSNTGYLVLGLIYAQASPPHGFGIPIPQFVKDELNFWINYIQNDIDGDEMDGGSGYDGPNYWVNILKTGTLLQEMAFVGDTLATPRVDEAIKYIERHWNDMNYDPGWKWVFPPVHKQAMYTTMKGFEAFNINLIDTDADGNRDDDWFNEFADALLTEQAGFPEGHWDGDPWAGDYVLPTCWALLTLEKAAPPVAEYDLTVHVVDDTNNNPISGATVTATGPEIRSDVTDGGFVEFLDILAGDYLVSASAAGYDTESMIVPISADTEITIRLKPSGPTPVGGVEAPTNPLTLLAPWIILALAISFGAVVAARKIKR